MEQKKRFIVIKKHRTDSQPQKTNSVNLTSDSADDQKNFNSFKLVSQEQIIKLSPKERTIVNAGPGTGKTYTGLGALVNLYESKKRLAIIIVCPYQHLVEQWVEDIIKFNMSPTIGYSSSPQKDWKRRLFNDIMDFKLKVISSFCDG